MLLEVFCCQFDVTCVTLCMPGTTLSQSPQQAHKPHRNISEPREPHPISLLNRMSSDCMFEVQNLIWQVKQQKSEAGRSWVKLQI